MSNIDEKWLWGIHTYDDNLFLNKNVIAIGWKELGDLSRFPIDREIIKKEYAAVYPNDPKGSIPTCVGMLFRFCFEVKEGDYVVYPSKFNRMINIGVVQGPYYFDPDEENYPQKRNIKWIKSLPRTAFSQGALHEIGSALTFFAIRNYADEFIAALDQNYLKNIQQDSKDDDTVGATADEIIQSTKDFILKELFRQLKGYDLEGFVADLLNAMGYRTSISPHGGDSGIDIIAYKDELPPRIAVQVKSQDSDITENTLQSLKGAMMPGDYGLFVTLSNYKKNAQSFLKANPIIRGINGTELVDLVLKYYDLLSEKYQKIIPLRRVYIPVAKDDE